MAASNPSRRTRRFAALQPRTLNVSQSAIKKRWVKLPEASQLRVRQLLQSIEYSVQHRDGESAAGVQSVVANLANTLRSKLPRMPFPPKTEEAVFDYEATLNRTRMLEAQLTADLHSAGLVKVEIEKERRLLEEDQKELQQLEKALRDEEARRQRHDKGLHRLAKTAESYPDKLRTTAENGGLQPNGALSFRDLESDASVEELLRQLHCHLESMQNNTACIEEIPSAINISAAALDCFSWRCLGQEKYAQLHSFDET